MASTRPTYSSSTLVSPVQLTLCSEPSYVIESRVSLTQAAKENTQQILERPRVESQEQAADCFQSGKFTFEPEHRIRAPPPQVDPILDTGLMSFGQGNLHLSPVGAVNNTGSAVVTTTEEGFPRLSEQSNQHSYKQANTRSAVHEHGVIEERREEEEVA